MSKPVVGGAIVDPEALRDEVSPGGDPADRAVSRRDALRTLAGGTAGLVALVGAVSPGCQQAAPEATAPGELPVADAVEVPASDLGPETRLVVQYGEVPVEVRRTPDGVEAIALLCTHLGCKVVWKDDLDRYQCACHEGQFDFAGRPVAGIPTRPLWRVPAAVSAATIVIGGPAGR
jgi:cytochrome b6-f complex iron-sulfur subunit